MDKGHQMRLEGEAGWYTGPPCRAGQVSTAQGHSVVPQGGAASSQRVPLTISFMQMCFFLILTKALQSLINCGKEPAPQAYPPTHHS